MKFGRVSRKQHEQSSKVDGTDLPSVAKHLFNMTLSEALENGICLKCKESALPKCYSDAGIEEYHESGICEMCFDKLHSCS